MHIEPNKKNSTQSLSVVYWTVILNWTIKFLQTTSIELNVYDFLALYLLQAEKLKCIDDNYDE